MQLSCFVGILDVEINIDIHIHIIHIHIIHTHTTNRPCDMNAIPSLFLTLFWIYEIIAYYEKQPLLELETQNNFESWTQSKTNK